MAAREDELGRIEIRRLSTLPEFKATLRLQEEIWGFDPTDEVPTRMFGVFSRIGGACVGAFADGEMIGFSLAFAAFKPTGLRYWHSHMVGVSPWLHGRGIGYQIKLRQRDEALAAGLDLIEWTFDPLQARNAYFNIAKLGVEVEAYLPNFYGITSSGLHGSLPTDRLVAAWHLSSPAVVDRLSGDRPGRPGPGEMRIEVPARISEVPHSQALEVQDRIRAQFQAALARGLRVTGFSREQGAGVYYLGA